MAMHQCCFVRIEQLERLLKENESRLEVLKDSLDTLLRAVLDDDWKNEVLMFRKITRKKLDEMHA